MVSDVCFSAEQLGVLAEVERSLISGRQVTKIAGLAGTGKSALLAELAHRHPGAKLIAPTGKAASVLRARTRLPATTIHRAFMELHERRTDAAGRKHPTFGPAHVPGALRGALFLVDEGSMIDSALGREMLLTGAQFIIALDPGQLPPVSGKPAFRPPFDFTLREIHRQALQSGIVRQAHVVRRGGNYQRDGEFECDHRASDDDLLAADAALVWTNETRRVVNRRLRAQRGFTGLPQRGEPIICLRNCPKYDLYNGEVFTLAAPFDPRHGTLIIERDGREVAIPRCEFIDANEDQDRGKTLSFDFGYALTVQRRRVPSGIASC